MGLRDRTTSRVRDRDLRIAQTGGWRILAARAAAAVRRFALHLVERAKGMALPDMTREEDEAAAGARHFAETAAGGIAITFGILLAVMLLLWIGTLF